jgi:hypothetical protein
MKAGIAIYLSAFLSGLFFTVGTATTAISDLRTWLVGVGHGLAMVVAISIKPPGGHSGEPTS